MARKDLYLKECFDFHEEIGRFFAVSKSRKAVVFYNLL